MLANIQKLLVAAMLVVSTMLVTIVPVVNAHTCTAIDPAANCGDCNDDLIPHHHTYQNGTTYCSSRPVLVFSCEAIVNSVAVTTKWDVCESVVVINRPDTIETQDGNPLLA